MSLSAGSPRTWSFARFALLALVLATALMWPAAVNRAPILYADTLGYFRSGEAAINAFEHVVDRGAPGKATKAEMAQQVDTRGDGVSTQRSVYYGIFVSLLCRLGGSWAVAAVQALLAAVTVLLALRRLGVTGLPRVALIAATLTLVGGLALFTVALMPDVFLGLMLLSMAMLIGFNPRMGWGERLWFLLVVGVAILFHRSHLVVAVLLAALSAVGVLAWRRTAWTPTALLAAVCAAGVLAHAAVDVAVTRVTGTPPVGTPFLLARLVGDGTAGRYLADHCQPPRLEMCNFRGVLPITENQFLWSRDPKTGVFLVANPTQRVRLAAEEKEIVFGTLREHPLDQARASAWNSLRQFITVGASEYGIFRGVYTVRQPGFEGELATYRRSAIATRKMPLAALSWQMAGAYFVGLAGLAAIAVVRRRRDSTAADPQDWTGFWIAASVAVAGLAINAVVTGSISGVFDRYQGRGAWVVLLFLLVALTRMIRPAARR